MSDDSQARKPENPARNNGDGWGERGSRSGSYPQKSGSYLPDIHRSLPQSLDAEKGLLCSALLSPGGVMGDCVERISGNHFYHPPHQTIYEIMVQQWKDSKPVDFITLTQILNDHDQLEACGGPATISELFTFVPTAANATFYLEIVREKFLLRSMIATCTEAASRCYEEQGEVKVLLDDVEKSVMAIGEDRFKGNLPDMRTMILSAIEEIETLYHNKGGLTGLSTGFKQLDQMTGGMRGAEMFVIAARPSMGKTAFSMNIAEHVAISSQKAVAVFSLEMSSSQLVQRLLCSSARVNLQRIRDGFLSRADSEKIGKAAKLLIESRIFIDDTPGITVLELRAKARRLQAQHGIELHRHRLPPTPALQLETRPREPSDRNRGNLRRHQSSRQGTQYPRHRPRPAQPKSREPHRCLEGPTAYQRSSRIRLHRAGRRHRRTPRSLRGLRG